MKGEYVIFFDADDLMSPDFITSRINEIKKPAPQSIEIQVNDDEEEDQKPEKIEVVKFKPVKYMKKLLVY